MVYMVYMVYNCVYYCVIVSIIVIQRVTYFVRFYEEGCGVFQQVGVVLVQVLEQSRFRRLGGDLAHLQGYRGA
jgi:hypothetical protein